MADSVLPSTNLVERLEPFHFNTDDGEKGPPLAVSVNDALPALTDEGQSELMRLGCAPLIFTLVLRESVPLESPSASTVTLCVPFVRNNVVSRLLTPGYS